MGQAVGNSSKASSRPENNGQAMPEKIGRPVCPAEMSFCEGDLALEQEPGNGLIS